MDKLTSRMLAVARFAHAYWFFGNLYEAVVRTPDTVIDNSSVTGLKPGSPVRYYLPAIPAVAATTVAGAALGWRRGGSRPALATAVGCLAASGALSAYLIRSVNLPMLSGEGVPEPAERDAMLRTWYRLNAVRLVCIGGGWLALRRAARHTARSDRSGARSVA